MIADDGVRVIRDGWRGGQSHRMYQASCVCGWESVTSILDLARDRVRRHRRHCTAGGA